jgi:hypothetical protein
MSTYIDPATALRLAHTARDAEIHRADEHRLSRSLVEKPPEPPRQQRRRHLALHWPRRIAHAG